MQETLFDNEVDDGGHDLSGLRVRIDGRRCQCGSNTFETGAGKAMHKASLHCASCSRHAGWLSAESAGFLAEIIAHFGRPTEPIVVRRKGDKP
jgi:hypothetical protein